MKSLSGPLFFQILCAGLLVVATRVQAQTLTIGVPQFPADLNILSSGHPAAELARAGVTGGLVIPGFDNNKPAWRLHVADSYFANIASGKFSYRLKSGMRFYNRDPVSLEDVKYSLERCLKNSGLPGVSAVAARTARRGTFTEDWVDLELRARAGQAGPVEVQKISEELQAGLAGCPILSKKIAESFGSDLGQGTNIVSAAPYFIADFLAGREIRLERSPLYVKETGANTLVFRGFSEPLRGLTALRTGTIDVLLSPDEEALHRAQKDDTLLLSKCSKYIVIARKGLQLGCEPGIDLTSFRYSS